MEWKREGSLPVAPEPLGTEGHVPPPLWEMAGHGGTQKGKKDEPHTGK